MTDNEMIGAWRTKFYSPHADNPALEEMHFESIAIGFFVALGADIDRSIRLYAKCVQRKWF